MARPLCHGVRKRSPRLQDPSCSAVDVPSGKSLWLMAEWQLQLLTLCPGVRDGLVHFKTLIHVLTSKELVLSHRGNLRKGNKVREKGIRVCPGQKPSDLVKGLTAFRILKNWGVIRHDKTNKHTPKQAHTSLCRVTLCCQKLGTCVESVKDCEC